MKQKNAYYFSVNFLLLMGLSFINDAKAQWPRGQGNAYLQFSYGAASASDEFNGNGNLQVLGGTENPQDYSENTIFGYLEYGLTDKLTFIASTFYKDVFIEERGQDLETAGLSDLTLQARYTLLQTDKFVLSPQVGVKIPTGYDEDTNPPLGSGETDLLLNITAGFSFFPVPAYISAGLGTKFRDGPQQDEIFGYLEGGYYITSNLLLRGRFDFLESTTNTNNSFNVAEQAIVTTGPGITYSVLDSIHLSVDGKWTVGGRTTSQLTNFLGGVTFTF